MRKIIPVLLCLFYACNSSTHKLQEGLWTGTLTPMNHPNIANPISYDVSYPNDNLTVIIHGPNDSRIITRNPHIQKDTLYFEFNEPEEQVFLECALAKNSGNKFKGRCTDSSGKWAIFTMIPPE